MFARRNYELVAEDIYVFCFSATNALPDKRLDKSCLRPQLDFDSTHIEKNEANLQANEENKDIQSLISQCLKLQEKVMNLEATVKEQETRISNIEAENTRSKLKTVISASSDRSTDQAEGRVSGQPMKAMPRTPTTPPQPGDDQENRQKQNKPASIDMTSSSDGRVHSTTSKKTSDAVQSPEQSKPTEPANHQDVRDQNSNSNAGFRHSSQERKNILRGSVRVNGANNQKDIRGASNSNHRIKAAVQNSVVSNILVYVGKLAPNTTCDDVRCHLNDVNIDNVSDVMILNGIGRSQECSFCVSLDNEESMIKMFNPIIWPSGTVVRPFRPARAKRTREKRGPQKEYNRHHRWTGRFSQRKSDTNSHDYNRRWRNYDSYSHYTEDPHQDWVADRWDRSYNEHEYY